MAAHSKPSGFSLRDATIGLAAGAVLVGGIAYAAAPSQPRSSRISSDAASIIKSAQDIQAAEASLTASPSPTPSPTVASSPSPTPTQIPSPTQTSSPTPTTSPSPTSIPTSPPAVNGSFPTAATAGVPGHTTLTTNTTTTINGNGGTYAAQRFGCVTINGNNNVIKDSAFQAVGGYVCVQLNGTGNQITDSTISGTNSGSGAVQYAVRDYGSGNQLIGDYVHFCTQCVYSSVTAISNSFISVDAAVAGIHYEAIYNPGGGGGMNIQHSTIINTHLDQTAAYYSAADTNGTIQGVTINASYLSGGGFVIYPYGHAGDKVVNEVITNNTIGPSQYGFDYAPGIAGVTCSGNVSTSGAPLSC